MLAKAEWFRAAKLFQGWERKSWEVEASPGTGGLCWGLSPGTPITEQLPAPFPSLNEQHNPNLMLGEENHICHSVRAELLALLQLPCNPQTAL